MDDPEENQILEFVTRRNIKRFREMLAQTSDKSRRERLSGLLASEESRLSEIRPGPPR